VKAQCLSDKRIPSALTLRLLRRGSATRRKRQAGCLLFDPTKPLFSQRKMDLLLLPIRWLSLREALLFRITWPAPAIRFGAVLAM